MSNYNSIENFRNTKRDSTLKALQKREQRRHQFLRRKIKLSLKLLF